MLLFRTPYALAGELAKMLEFEFVHSKRRYNI